MPEHLGSSAEGIAVATATFTDTAAEVELTWAAATDRAGYEAGEAFDCGSLLGLDGAACHWVDDATLRAEAPDEVVVESSLTVSSGFVRAACSAGNGV